VPKFIEQLQALWSSLSTRQQISLVVFAALIGGSLWSLQRWNVEKDFRPLYTEMANEEAGSVIARLRELGIPYRLNEAGTTILIPSERLAETRLQLATDGLPRHGRMGFELFDQTKFGATEFSEQVNYRRALEGELERSVLSLAQVEEARVHITLPKDSVFLDYQQPAKASVVVKLRRAQGLDAGQVRGLGYLVASAVEGLTAEMVSVIDVRGNLLSRPKRSDKETSDEQTDLEQRIERETAQKILHTLEPYLGADKARASVSAETEMNAGEQTEEIVDPNPVMVSTQKSEEDSQPSFAGGEPGTASNVPRGAGRPAGSGSSLTRKQENTTYQTSRTVTRMKLEKGAVKRLSVAVIVDNKLETDGAGRRSTVARTPEEMKTIRDLVSASAGILESRGDLLTIENLPFETRPSLEPLDTIPKPPPAVELPLGWRGLFKNGPFNKDWLVGHRYMLMGASAGLLGVIALLVIWRRKLTRRAPAVATAISGAAQGVEKQLASRESAQREADEAALLELKMPQVTSNKALVLRKVLAEGARKDTAATVQLLRSWIHEDES